MSMYTNGFGVTTREAMGEKQDMQELNNKLAQYMQRVNELKKAAAIGGDAASYNETMRLLDNEIQKIKALYENELAKLRRQLDEANKDKNRLLADTHRMGDAQGKLSQEANRARKLEDDVKALEKALADRDRENDNLRAHLKQMEVEAAKAQKLARENEDLRRKLAEDGKHIRDLEEKLKVLGDKHKFDNHMHDAQTREMQERIKTANDIIKALEDKMKQLSQMGANLPAQLQKMREGTMAEMKMFQKETEDALNRNIDSLKKQMDDDSRTKEQLARENRHLEDTIRKMAAKNADLDGKINALIEENNALRGEVDHERARAQMAIKELEKKLKDLQDTLLNNSKEFATARDAQASLRAEIETYRRLLEGEANRLGSRAGSRATTPMKTGTNFVANNALPALSRSQTPRTTTYKTTSYRPGYNSFHTTYRTDYTAKTKGTY